MSDIYGLYKHYKGNIYIVLSTAKHTETNELLVLYQSIEGDLWVRPYEMFFGTVLYKGRNIKRFTKLK